jgi:DNA-binding NtrC family response regulator
VVRDTDTIDDVEPTQSSDARGPARPRLILAYAHGGRREVEHAALPPEGVLLGRDALLFPGGLLDDTQLSRRHAELRPERGRWILRDLGSRNGTFVDGTRLAGDCPIESGAVIRVGATLLVYARMAASGSERVPVAPSLVGMSDATAAVRRAIELAAGRQRAVLITGETGTGKELVAEALHQHSGRPGRLVAVNCAAFAEGTLASELFGHVRGAFTGAVGDRPGLFRSAHQGTLLLDEVGEMPAALQAQLLRALETGRVRPVGASDDTAVDVVVVGATNRDLVAEVAAGRFRADLYSRLAQWMIHLTPLRERREDLPYLVRHLAERAGAGARGMSVKLAEALLVHPWPLNVRGLRNVLAIAALASPPDGPLDLLPEVAAALEASRALAPEAAGATPRPQEVPTAEQLAEALDHFHGKVAAVARHFGATRQQLYRWLEKRGIDPRSFRHDDD